MWGSVSAKCLIYVGFFLSIGLGVLLPSQFDMVWRVAGSLFMLVGVFLLIASRRSSTGLGDE